MRLNQKQRDTVNYLPSDRAKIEQRTEQLCDEYDKRQAEAERDWEESAKLDRAEGHAPHYCIHGVSQWVDYDIPCGACEMGDPEPEDVVDYYRAQAENEFECEMYVTRLVLELNQIFGGAPEVHEHLMGLFKAAQGGGTHG